MKRDYIKILMKYIFYIGLGLLIIRPNHALPADNNFVSYITPFVKEQVVTVGNIRRYPTGWRLTKGVTAKREQNFALNGLGYMLDVHYNFQSAGKNQIKFYYNLPKNHFIGETLMFWLKGDGSQNTLHVECFYKGQWIPLTSGYQSLFPLLLKKKWQHIEIPASNPLYRFYNDVTAFRFTIVKQDKKKQSGNFLIGDLKFTKPLPVVTINLSKQMWKNKKIISPAFDTWGTPPISDFKIGKKIGINISIIPCEFSSKNIILKQNIEGTMKEILAADKSGIMGGIELDINHSEKFIKHHSELLMKNEKGQLSEPKINDGFPFSPWNPLVWKLNKKNIIQILDFLKKEDFLKHIKIVKIAPGTESEVSYEWSHIWAFDKYAIKSYHKYLRAMYNNINSLNQDWATKYRHFTQIIPPHSWYPDRRHWVFYNFYRLSLLKYTVRLVDDVKSVFTPKYWLYLLHSVPSYPTRFYSARDPLFYGKNLARLGVINYAHLVLDWQTKNDVEYIKKLGIIPICEWDVNPPISVQKNTFKIAKELGYDGVFIGIMESEVANEKPTKLGRITMKLIKQFKKY